jgi:hypothetical protein
VEIIGVNSKCCSRVCTKVLCVTCGSKQFRMCVNVESVFLGFLKCHFGGTDSSGTGPPHS